MNNYYYAKNRDQWRNWLTKNAASGKEVWLMYYKKDSRKSSISHEEAVKEAICFGWIDGIVKKLMRSGRSGGSVRVSQIAAGRV